MEQERKYRAFFSYARADEHTANWLWGLLDRYHTPQTLIGAAGEFGPIPARLHPIFRDREDLSGGGALPERLRRALADSDALIVLCTQASAESAWVNQEVLAFLEFGREDRIFPVIANSNAAWPADGPAENYMPPALRERGFLAADLREEEREGVRVGDGRRRGVRKLIAGLLGAPLDDFVRRDARRRDMRALTLSSIAVAAITSALAALSYIVDTTRTAGDAQAAASWREVQLVEQHAAFLVERADLREAARNAMLARRLGGGRHDVTLAETVLRRIAQSLPAHSRINAPEMSSSVTFSDDGSVAVHGSPFVRGVHVVDYERGAITLTLPDHNLLGLSGDGRTLAARLLGQVHLYDVATGRVTMTTPLAGENTIISRDLRLLAANLGGTNTLRVTDLRDGAQREFGRGGDSLHFHWDGRILYVLDYSGVAAYAVASGRELWRMRCRQGQIAIPNQNSAIALLCDSQEDAYVAVLNADSGAQLQRIDLGGSALYAFLAIDRAGDRIALGSSEGIRVWDAASGAPLWSDALFWSTDSSDYREERRVSFSWDNAQITSVSDSVPIVWDAASGERLTRFAHAASAVRTDFLPDGRLAVRYEGETTIRLFAPQGARTLARFRLSRSNRVDLNIAADGARAAVVLDQHAFVVPLAEPAPRAEYQAPTTIVSWRMNRDGGALVFDFSQPDRSTGWWSADTLAGVTGAVWRPDLNEITEILGADDSDLTSPAISDDGARAAFTSGVETRVFDARSGDLLTTLQHDTRTRSLTFSRDGARLLAEVVDPDAQPEQFLIWQVQPSKNEVWDIASAQLLTLAPDSQDFGTDETFAEDGGIDLASSNGRVTLVDPYAHVLMPTDLRYEEPQRHAFSADGRVIAIISGGEFAAYDISQLLRPIADIEADLCADLILPQPPSDWTEQERSVGGICGIEIAD